MSQPFIVVLLVIATATLQLGSQTMLDRMNDVMGKSRAGHAAPRRWAYSIAAVVVLMVGHMLQIAVWALCYYAWGDLGSMRDCLYFSLASFTTVGANDLDLQPIHRMAGAVEAGVGMLMFGWSTALLVEIIRRTSRLQRT
jgi:hypothetical protein